MRVLSVLFFAIAILACAQVAVADQLRIEVTSFPMILTENNKVLQQAAIVSVDGEIVEDTLHPRFEERPDIITLIILGRPNCTEAARKYPHGESGNRVIYTMDCAPPRSAMVGHALPFGGR